MAKGVTVRGPFMGPSGYDTHVREFVRALSLQGVAVELKHLETWGPTELPYHLRDPWFESLSAPVEASAVVHFTLPSQVVRDDTRPNINFTMFEATRIPALWAAMHHEAELIVLPTEHSRRAWIASGVPEAKLRMCPLGVRTDRFRPGVPPMELGDVAGRPVSSYAVRFLNVSELGPRKNLVGLLTAWLRATSRGDDAVFVMKVGCYGAGSLARFEAEVRAAELRAGRRLDEAAPIHFVYELYPDADMPRLFATATHYMSMSFGEGWDLSMTQAAATGLRLIAPRHSAYLDYLDDEVASMISARETPAVIGDGSSVAELFAGARWWAPDDDEAVQRIRSAIAGEDAPRASARERMRERFTWERSTMRLVEIIEEAGAMPRPR